MWLRCDRRRDVDAADRQSREPSGPVDDRHRANVLEKLGMRNRVELTRYAIRRGLVVP
jgi:hypothetical protein